MISRQHHVDCARPTFAATEAVQADSSFTFHMQKKKRTRECHKLKEKGVKTKILLEHFEATKYCIHDGKVDESDASEVDVDSDDES